MLRTIEDVLGLQPYFGAASSAHDMSDFFATTNAANGSCGVPNSPGALLCSPLPGQTYGSPVAFDGAGKGASRCVNHLELWIDGGKLGNYFSDQLSTSVALSNGSHTATLVEVDSTGAFLKSTPTNFTVGCAAPASPGARLCSPVPGQTFPSTVQVTGSGTCADGLVEHLELWIDGHKIGNYAGRTISTTVTSTSGAHAATLVAVDARVATGNRHPSVLACGETVKETEAAARYSSRLSCEPSSRKKTVTALRRLTKRGVCH